MRKRRMKPRFQAARQPALNRHPAAKAGTACERARTRRPTDGGPALGGDGCPAPGASGRVGLRLGVGGRGRRMAVQCREPGSRGPL